MKPMIPPTAIRCVALARALVVVFEVSSWTRPSTGHVLDPIIAPIFTNLLSVHLVSHIEI